MKPGNHQFFFPFLAGLIGFALLLISATGALAQTTNTWTGQTGSDWNTAANWSRTAVPGTGDDVVIPAGTTNAPILSTNAVAKSVEVQPGASFTISTTGSLTVNGYKGIPVNSIPYAIAFFNGGTVINQGGLSAGNTATVGLCNASSFSNLTGGSITIDGTSSQALYNSAGTFVNAATIRIGSLTGAGSVGIENQASFSNVAGGTITIDRTTSRGIYNTSGTFNNTGTVRIGSIADPGPWGIENQASFSNVTSGTITIDRTNSIGIYNTSGTFNNAGTIRIGAVNAVSSSGLLNKALFTNVAGGSIDINLKNQNGTGLFNESPGSLVNSATITLGSISSAGGFGLSNQSSFSNLAGGNIIIDRSGSYALINSSSGSFINAASITIGTVPDVGAGTFGLSNQASFSNVAGGSIAINRTGSLGLSNSSSFVNSATITIGTVAGVGFSGLSNSSSFSNLTGGNISIDRTDNISLSTSNNFVNQATITIGASVTGNAIAAGGVFTNQGCQALINSLGDAVISGSSSFSNTGTIIERSSGNSSISYNGGLVQDLNGGNFSIGLGNVAVTGVGLFWRGCVSSDWNTAANWSAGTVPTATDDVTIPAGTAYSPVLSTTAVANSVEVQTGASFTISSSGSLTINSSKTYGVFTRRFSNSGQVRNAGRLVLGNTGSVGYYGLYNDASFTNTASGSIQIDQTSNTGLYNNTGGHFVNSATIVIGSVASVGLYGLYNASSFTNTAGGTILIDNVDNSGIRNQSGSFVNSATVIIGSKANTGISGVNNTASFSNTMGGFIQIDKTVTYGLNNNAGSSFVNSASVIIGANASVGNFGLYNTSSFSNTTGGILQIDRFNESGLINSAGSFVNSATITIGSIASTGSFGVDNYASFTNTAGGVIQIDRVTGFGLRNNSGNFVNLATVTIGSIASTGPYGIQNLSSFTNTAGGIIQIDRASDSGLENNSGSFVNSATITIGSIASTGPYGIRNLSSFTNTAGGSIQIDRSATDGLANNVNTSFINSATITIGASATGNAINNFGVFNNQGCQALINSLGNATITNYSSFSNTGTIIERSSNNSSISYNGGLVQDLNGGNFAITSGQPPLSVSATGLTTCNPVNGSFTIAGVQPATAYTLSYTVGNTTASLTQTGNGAGQLSVANLSGGTYALALSGSCVAQTLPLSATLGAPAAFTLTTQPPATSVVCAGAAVSATVGVSGTTAPVTYQWYKNTLASPVTSQTAAILSLTNLTTAESGSYFVVITDNCSSATSTAFSLMVNTISGFTVSSATVCPGQSANLTASGCSGQILWSTGATTAMITLTAGSSTSLLTATCTAGVCSATANGQVVVGGIQPPPAQILSFTADESACPVRLTGRGVATSFTMTGPKDYVFSTVFREGATHEAVGLNVKQAGTYTLTATYTNSCGTSAPVTRTVAVSKTCP